MRIGQVIADILQIINRSHADLQDLDADDHEQYHTDARGDAKYYLKTLLDAGQLDNRYYTETELDALFSALDYYTQAEVDALFSALDYYTEAEVDALIGAIDHYTQAEVDALIGAIDHYTQAEVDALIADVPTEEQLKTITVTLSAANIKAMYDTPVELIPAPGAGKVILVEFVLFSFDYGGTAFANGSDVNIQYDTTSTSILNYIIGGADMRLTADWLQYFRCTATTAAIVPIVNEGIEITNIGLAFTTGNSIMKVFIKYRIITL